MVFVCLYYYDLNRNEQKRRSYDDNDEMNGLSIPNAYTMLALIAAKTVHTICLHLVSTYVLYYVCLIWP